MAAKDWRTGQVFDENQGDVGKFVRNAGGRVLCVDCHGNANHVYVVIRHTATGKRGISSMCEACKATYKPGDPLRRG